ncbi:hypothetical protein [Aureibacter tunicatorum]|uniref:Uncharacterized protein n=1 Tax=Aureibacter tunicatorum TaxID=866807 RepID=A0AAE3XTX3_9BACT|nr:hypothetical protein [Aureibacter tunicatorum]MDR6241889.1 hypothetical protein [Aureibacter tunicatorum]BDD07496.1 hypothetical protein AUTU_49790 [Aureibacter tunicatorum]
MGTKKSKSRKRNGIASWEWVTPSGLSHFFPKSHLLFNIVEKCAFLWAFKKSEIHDQNFDLLFHGNETNDDELSQQVYNNISNVNHINDLLYNVKNISKNSLENAAIKNTFIKDESNDHSESINSWGFSNVDYFTKNKKLSDFGSSSILKLNEALSNTRPSSVHYLSNSNKSNSLVEWNQVLSNNSSKLNNDSEVNQLKSYKSETLNKPFQNIDNSTIENDNNVKSLESIFQLNKNSLFSVSDSLAFSENHNNSQKRNETYSIAKSINPDSNGIQYIEAENVSLTNQSTAIGKSNLTNSLANSYFAKNSLSSLTNLAKSSLTSQVEINDNNIANIATGKTLNHMFDSVNIQSNLNNFNEHDQALEVSKLDYSQKNASMFSSNNYSNTASFNGSLSSISRDIRKVHTSKEEKYNTKNKNSSIEIQTLVDNININVQEVRQDQYIIKQTIEKVLMDALREVI